MFSTYKSHLRLFLDVKVIGNTELLLRVSHDRSKNIDFFCYKMQCGENDDGVRKEKMTQPLLQM